jgi:hypothetical protein
VQEREDCYSVVSFIKKGSQLCNPAKSAEYSTYSVDAKYHQQVRTEKLPIKISKETSRKLN